MTEPFVFQHEAMKTSFTFRILSKNTDLAQDAAYSCANLLNEIEGNLSRYREASDVWFINHMRTGESRFISERCYECLRLAMEVSIQTNGLFDITLGQQIQHQKNGVKGPPPPLSGQLMIDPDKPAIHCVEAGREIDLGGIGKGYALDEIKKLMQEWDIESALISAGSSSQLAFGNTAWDIELRGDYSQRTIKLKDQALSVSGVGIQACHIVSPHSELEDYLHKRLWYLHEYASMADAWSTAIMLMTEQELHALTQLDACIYAERKHGIMPL